MCACVCYLFIISVLVLKQLTILRLLDFRSPFGMSNGNKRFFSVDVTHLPTFKDPEIFIVVKDLLAASQDELADPLVNEAKKALSKSTDDKAGQEALENVYRSAEAVEEFGGKLVSLRMEIDDSIGLSGEVIYVYMYLYISIYYGIRSYGFVVS